MGRVHWQAGGENNMKNQTVINLRKAYKEGLLTKQQYKTLKGQVLEGKERAAVKGFKKIIRRNRQEVGVM